MKLSRNERYILALAITIATAALEIIGSVSASSISLLSDGLHVATDALSLLVGLGVEMTTRSHHTVHRTQRRRALGGFIIGFLLFIAAVVVIGEASHRFFAENLVIQSTTMGALAFLGMLFNIVTIQLLKQSPHTEHHRHETEETMTHRFLITHIVYDALQSLTVIVGSIIIFMTGAFVVDLILGIALGLWMGGQSLFMMEEAWTDFRSQTT